MEVNNVCVADIVALYRREMQELLADLFYFSFTFESNKLVLVAWGICEKEREDHACFVQIWMFVFVWPEIVVVMHLMGADIRSFVLWCGDTKKKKRKMTTSATQMYLLDKMMDARDVDVHHTSFITSCDHELGFVQKLDSDSGTEKCVIPPDLLKPREI